MKTYGVLNDILVVLFNDILTIEEKALITEEFADISVNDMHIIEAIGIEGNKSMSVVAASMKVTVGTLTIAMNNLVKKGYVNRKRKEEDRRVVLVFLTQKGVRAFRHHVQFHENMIEATMINLNENEREVLAKALTSLGTYFRKIYSGE